MKYTKKQLEAGEKVKEVSGKISELVKDLDTATALTALTVIVAGLLQDSSPNAAETWEMCVDAFSLGLRFLKPKPAPTSNNGTAN